MKNLTVKEIRYAQSMRSCAAQAKSELRKFLRLVGVSENYRDIRRLVLDIRVTDRRLTQLASNGGYPDWPDEHLEEKGKKLDFIRVQQYARALIYYRANLPYRVAWRFTSTKRKVFETVFDFYDFLQTFSRPKKKTTR